MEIKRIRALRGPNVWSRHTSIEAILALSSVGADVFKIDGFESALLARYPHMPSLHSRLLPRPVTLAHVLELATLSLQAQAGCPVTFSRTHATPEAGVFQVVVEYSEEEVGRRAIEEAKRLIDATRMESHFDWEAVVNGLRELDEDVRLGPSTGSIVTAALSRGIPYHRLTSGSLVQFGWGARQRRIQAAEMDQTSAISESIAQDKELTKRLLEAAGVPVPYGRPVRNKDDAWAAALEIGLPVVVKPQDGNQGKGVTVNIDQRLPLEAAYDAAAEFRDDVMVEKYLAGHDYRLLVVGDKLVAAARREPPTVIGDGTNSIRVLVDKVNQDPRRGAGHATSLTKIRLDDIAVSQLAQQGLTPDSVPQKGVRVILRNNANLSTGGTATDVTDDVHPDLAARAVDAARMVGLHVCGVDVICDTVLKPLEAQGGGIVEVNAAPGLRMHLSPSFGKGRDVGGAIISELYPNGGDGRIPVIAVTGTNGKTTTVRLISHLLRASGLTVGMTNTDGVYVNDRQIDRGDCSGPKSARNVLLHPEVDAAVFETARGGILREGLGFDRCSVAVVTNLGEGDHLGMNYIDTLQDLARVKSVIVQNVAPSGMAVLNAADPWVAQMAEFCPGKITVFALDRHLPLMAAHRARGRRVIYREEGNLVAEEGPRKYAIPLAQIPMTRGGLVSFQVQNAMAAVGAAWAEGIDWTAIAEGLASFDSASTTVPGRFNFFEFNGATVIADYGHNADAMRALVSAVEALPAKKRVVLISGAGDRRDEDIREQTRVLGQTFEEVLLYQDACQRGREDGEVLRLLQEGLVGASRTRYVEEIRGEFPAIDRALGRLNPGDLCLILVDQVDEALAHLRARVAAGRLS